MSRLLFLGLGAALMYFGDPQAGRKRRNDLRNQLEATNRRLQHGRDVIVRDATNRAHGLLVETRQVIEARRQPGLENAPTLRSIARGSVGAWRRDSWSPAQRALAGAFATGLATYGYFRGGLKGLTLCALGGALMARATGNESLGALARGKGILIEKTIHVDAPVTEAFAYWRDLENFPQWMSHVREVRYLGGDRHRWVVDGPAGRPVEWESELLNVVENQEMTWRSIEGSTVDNTGRVRFEQDEHGCRIHVQLRYSPPGGVLGHVVAKAFGVDPKSQMDEDLNRMKHTIETGEVASDTAAQRVIGSGEAGTIPPNMH